VSGSLSRAALTALTLSAALSTGVVPAGAQAPGPGEHADHTSIGPRSPGRPAGTTVAGVGEGTAHLPDLVLATTSDLRVITTRGGRDQLRFTSTLVNLGGGPLVVSAQRPTTESPWTVSQVIVAPDGTVEREVPMGLQPMWGGDGHNHWHVPDMARYRLLRLDDGQEVGANHKIGFCFFDNAFFRPLPQTPAEPEFPDDRGCAHGDRAATHFRMGLSVGFADVYRWRIPGQAIDISELPAGRYRLEGTANAQNALAESDTTNDVEWVDFQLLRGYRGATAHVLDSGWTPQPARTDEGSVMFGGGGARREAPQ
jgi:hypothetical protein